MANAIRKEEGITVMVDVHIDPSDAVRNQLQQALMQHTGVHSADFSPYVRRVMKVRYDAGSIKAADIGRVVHEALGAQGPNTYIVGM